LRTIVDSHRQLVVIDFDAALARTAERYAHASGRRASYWYVRGKLRGDPCARAIAERAPLGDVLDLGCGRGQLALFLVEHGAATRVRGCDADAAKIELAERAADGLDARFACADARDADAAPADTVLLIDVLHYFAREDQDALLARAARLVKPGGRLFIREATTSLGIRSHVTRAFEWLAAATRINRGERLVYRDIEREVVPALEASGMRCAIEPCWQGTPFGNVLVVAERTR
jgi:2-polyprenyl-3-methyl-5-hydroxy-6-metoxy-1,4-benzoquinol methylase